MATLPQPQHALTTATAILRSYDQAPEYPRAHLGCSIIGRECERQLWYGFRWAAKRGFDGRMMRLFDTGKREEARFEAELKRIGVEFYAFNPETGQQFQYSAIDGHFGGSCDGIGRGFPEAPKAWAVCEQKTHNENSFAELVKKGVKEAKPDHWNQMQMYMGFAGLDRACYLAANKNTDELYSEWIHFDKEAFDRNLAKAERIIRANEPPQRISEDPAWFKCKMCDFRQQCHGNAIAAMNCRTCCHSSPVADGQWHCAQWNANIPAENIADGCGEHLYLPGLVPYAKPVDSRKQAIIYQHNTNGRIFANVGASCDIGEDMGDGIDGAYPSSELAVMVAGLVADPGIDALRNTFGATVVSSAAIDSNTSTQRE